MFRKSLFSFVAIATISVASYGSNQNKEV